MKLFSLVDFQDINVEEHMSGGNQGYYKAHVKLSDYFKHFNDAQIWLDRQIMTDMTPFVAYRTGRLLSHLRVENSMLEGTGQIMAYTLPYGEATYKGLNANGQPITHWTNPQTTPYWFETARAVHERDWVNGCRKIILKGSGTP